MEIITLTEENLEREHICCAISNNNDCQVSSKKAWLRERLKDGLVFKKCDVRGKCFIEYIPAEKAWAPVEADGWMYIDCLWVSGQFKGQGYSTLLLDECIADCKAKGKKGLVTLSSKRKQAFLADSKFLLYKGFERADFAEPYFELYALRLDAKAELPHFKPCAVNPNTDEDGLTLYYTNQCPFTAKYVPIIQAAAQERGVMLRAVKLETTEQAQSSPSPFTAYSLFYNGRFVTHEILSDKKFLKNLDELGL